MSNLEISRRWPTPIQNVGLIVATAFASGWPVTIPLAVYLLKHWAGKSTEWPLALTRATHCGHWAGKVAAWVHHLCTELVRSVHPTRSRSCSPEEEVRYWKESARYREALTSSDVNTTPHSVPLVRYYVPKLLPPYRSIERKDMEATEYHLPAKAFCKWHHMVFRGPLHPTLKQAEALITNYSSRDRREMYRIARLLTDEEAFTRKVPWTPRYRDMWKKWLDMKG